MWWLRLSAAGSRNLVHENDGVFKRTDGVGFRVDSAKFLSSKETFARES